MEELKKLRKLGSMLQGHPDRLFTPGVEVSSGSLGQSLSIAGGIALAGKLDKKDYYVYVILGDGELQEGQIWEAAMAAAHYKLSNLISFVDYNKYQIDGKIEEVINIEPLEDKWRAFGWYTTSIDGHDITQILETTKKIKAEVKDKPSVIIAHTIKGKGVSFMENQNKYHGVAPTPEEEKRALVEIGNFVAV
jgi:transketolase